MGSRSGSRALTISKEWWTSRRRMDSGAYYSRLQQVQLVKAAKVLAGAVMRESLREGPLLKAVLAKAFVVRAKAIRAIADIHQLCSNPCLDFIHVTRSKCVLAPWMFSHFIWCECTVYYVRQQA